MAFFAGGLRFPQGFWVVFCGDVVVGAWWNVVLCGGFFGA
jgi:hypothetical protein